VLGRISCFGFVQPYEQPNDLVNKRHCILARMFLFLFVFLRNGTEHQKYIIILHAHRQFRTNFSFVSSMHGTNTNLLWSTVAYNTMVFCFEAEQSGWCLLFCFGVPTVEDVALFPNGTKRKQFIVDVTPRVLSMYNTMQYSRTQRNTASVYRLVLMPVATVVL